MKICDIDGCSNAIYALGLCGKHYQRQRTHGDPLAGRTFEGDPERFLRGVALKHFSDECLKWPFAVNGRGYGTVYLDGVNRSVTRFLCEERHGPPPTPDHEAAHSCGNGDESCCNQMHLSWKTPAGNGADRVQHGTAKLTDDAVREIIALKGQMKQAEIAAQFGIHFSMVSRIHSGKRMERVANS